MLGLSANADCVISHCGAVSGCDSGRWLPDPHSTQSPVPPCSTDNYRAKQPIMKQTPQSPVDGTGRTTTMTSESSGTTSRVGWTDLSDHSAPPEATAAADELPTSAANSEVGGFTIPTELPDPEVTLFRDTTSVIRLLRKKRAADQFELRLYQADDQSVAHIVPVDGSGSNVRKNNCIEALPEVVRRRFEGAVDIVSERFSLSIERSGNSYGQCRHRRPHHGSCGVLEFSVTLRIEQPDQNL